MSQNNLVKCWVQEWEESERGWGTRPDGFTAHLKREHIALFLKKMRADETEIYKGQTPDEYSRPCGKPFEVELPPALRPPDDSIGKWLPPEWRKP